MSADNNDYRELGDALEFAYTVPAMPIIAKISAISKVSDKIGPLADAAAKLCATGMINSELAGAMGASAKDVDKLKQQATSTGLNLLTTALDAVDSVNQSRGLKI